MLADVQTQRCLITLELLLRKGDAWFVQSEPQLQEELEEQPHSPFILNNLCGEETLTRKRQNGGQCQNIDFDKDGLWWCC